MKLTESFNSSSSYRFIRRIGSGGSADLLLYAKRSDALPEQEVVLKVLKPRDAMALNELVNEGRKLSTLKHPHIVATFGYERLDNSRFGLVMEYIPGENLKTLAPKLRDEARHAVAAYVIRVLCDALAAAHEQGVIHGDVSARNVLISRHGMIKLTDFGLSRRLGGRGRSFFGKKGSADYLAPERWRGHFSSHQSDVFSLGIIAYELLTGINPLQAPNLFESRSKLDSFLSSQPWAKFDRWLFFFNDVFAIDPSRRSSAHDLRAVIPDYGAEVYEVQKELAAKIQTEPHSAETLNLTETVNLPTFAGRHYFGNLTTFCRVIGVILFFAGLCTSHATGSDYALSGRLRPYLLTVTSAPWGEVIIDGSSLGYTPMINVPVRAGIHHFVWRPRRGPSFTRSLTAFDNGLVAFQVVQEKGRPVRIAPIKPRLID